MKRRSQPQFHAGSEQSRRRSILTIRAYPKISSGSATLALNEEGMITRRANDLAINVKKHNAFADQEHGFVPQEFDSGALVASVDFWDE